MVFIIQELLLSTSWQSITTQTQARNQNHGDIIYELKNYTVQ